MVKSRKGHNQKDTALLPIITQCNPNTTQPNPARGKARNSVPTKPYRRLPNSIQANTKSPKNKKHTAATRKTNPTLQLDPTTDTTEAQLWMNPTQRGQGPKGRTNRRRHCAATQNNSMQAEHDLLQSSARQRHGTWRQPKPNVCHPTVLKPSQVTD